MKNAFSRFGQTCVQWVAVGGLITGTLLAGQVNRINVTLPHAVTVGSVTLPSGDYTISSLDMSDGDEFFIVRGEHTQAVTLQAQKVEASKDDAKKTQLVFSQDGDNWHLDKITVKGDFNAYQFVNVK